MFSISVLSIVFIASNHFTAVSADLSLRLTSIEQMVSKTYDHIWDCCCDHGQLGIELMQQNMRSTVHFVDVVEPIMLQLEQQLQLQSSKGMVGKNWRIHCLDVARLPLSEVENANKASQLVIIAGVGGDLLIELVHSIVSLHPTLNLEFILCPVHHNFKVREALIAMDFGLIDECLVKENRRYYEVLHLSQQEITPLSRVGSKMWNFGRKEDCHYLKLTIEHYQRVAQSGDDKVNRILYDYEALRERS
ncbi:tRNA (adenine(22)-N(1))-methyltransferase [Aliivibrio kagoshimensis]|uniref:tRNA (adenine(22)-N(1))-methyltransferase n=1 Tax=Aliivibrio kagoshimensis TaxID=2910230 RepID=UPI003D0B3B6B